MLKNQLALSSGIDKNRLALKYAIEENKKALSEGLKYGQLEDAEKFLDETSDVSSLNSEDYEYLEKDLKSRQKEKYYEDLEEDIESKQKKRIL